MRRFTQLFSTPPAAAIHRPRRPASALLLGRLLLGRLVLGRLVLGIAGMALAAGAMAHDARIGTIHIIHPEAPASLPGQTSGAVYLTLENLGSTADKLVSMSTPAAAGVSVHTMSMQGGVMKMRELPDLPLAPGARQALQPDSGYHLMLSGLKQPMRAGDKIPLMLRFEHAGEVEVSVHVGPSLAQKAGAAMPAHMH